MTKNPELIDEIKGHKSTILSAKFSPDDNNNIIAAGLENSIYYHKLNKSNYFYKILAHDDLIYSLDFGQFNHKQFFLSASRDRTVKLWRLDLNKEIINDEFEPVVYYCQNTVRFVNINPLNSSIFCTGSDDKSIKIWSANVPNKRLNTFTNHTNWIRCCKFSKKDPNIIASCSDDSTLRLFDLRINGMKGSILKTITTTRNRHFTYLDWYPLSEYFIAVSSSNNMIRIFDLRQMGKIIQFYKPFQDSVNCLDFHPNGHYLLASSSDSTSKLISVIEGRLLYTLKGHFKSIFNCTFNNDGTHMLTSGKDKSLKLWKLNLDNYLDNDDNSTIYSNKSYKSIDQNESYNNWNLRNDKINSSFNEIINEEKKSRSNLSFLEDKKNQLKNSSVQDLEFNDNLEDCFKFSNKTSHNIYHKSNNRINTKDNGLSMNKHQVKSGLNKKIQNLECCNRTSEYLDSNDNLKNLMKSSSCKNHKPLNKNLSKQFNIKEDKQSSNEEFDCILNQLNILEDYLLNLEIRLNKLENKLER